MQEHQNLDVVVHNVVVFDFVLFFVVFALSISINHCQKFFTLDSWVLIHLSFVGPVRIDRYIVWVE